MEEGGVGGETRLRAAFEGGGDGRRCLEIRDFVDELGLCCLGVA